MSYAFNVLTLQFLERLFDDLVKQNMSAEAIKCALLGEHTKLYEVVVSQLRSQAQVMFISLTFNLLDAGYFFSDHQLWPEYFGHKDVNLGNIIRRCPGKTS